MIIRIEALDTLFFRDSRPFNMSDDTWATGMFPPLPSVLYGALRTAYMAQNDNITPANIDEHTSNFRITQISYIVDTNKYLPLPLDILQESDINPNLSAAQKRTLKKNRKENKNDALTLTLSSQLTEENTPIFSTHAHTLAQNNNLANHFQYLSHSNDVENIDNGIIAYSDLANYFTKIDTNFNEILSTSTYIKPEPKIGIGLNNATTTVAEGKLYRVEMLRPKQGFSLQIEFEGIELAEKGLLKLGGEGKLASYTSITDTQPINSNINVNLNDTFKIYLATPAIFEKGYYPTHIFKNAKVEVELLSCAVGKSINVGGFDMVAREPKKLLRAVPAGSVYYFKLLSGNFADLQAAITKVGISECRTNEGFGIAYLGKI
jgi:CRISPR-associated protein Cmr3